MDCQQSPSSDSLAPDPDSDPDGDSLREKCGVFGIFGHPDAAAITALGLHALQHRGQEAAGIVTFDGQRFHSERRLGLVGDTFSRRAVIEGLPGSAAIGHTRYSTTGGTILRNVQPLFAELNAGGFAVAHNGNLTNGLTLRRELVSNGALMQSTSDTEAILHLVAQSRRGRFIERYIEALRAIEGAYALVSLTNKKLVGARDPRGIRPLVLGELDGCPILVSETCALDIIGAKYVRDIEPGEIIVFHRKDGTIQTEIHKPFPPMPPRPCIFEYIYFSRPDSIVAGRSVYEVRKAFGAQLARESHAEVDVVVPVPDSGVPAALGYSQFSGVPYELGIIRNHYVGRTFIQPAQSVRELGVRMMRDAGATEVHFRLASPPIIHPDYYGIDLPDRNGLLAATHSLEQMRDIIGADSLAFLSIDGMYRAMGEPGRDPANPKYSDHCFTGAYPTSLTDHTDVEPQPHQLSLLAEAS